MALTCLFQVGMFLCVIQGDQVMSAAEHPPVLEGGPVVLTCSGLSKSTQKRTLYWITTETGVRLANPAVCHSTEQSCQNYDSRYVASANFTDTSYITSLTILAVSQHERYMTFNCTLYEEEKDWAYIIQSWNMSKIVHSLENFTVGDNDLDNDLVNDTMKHVDTNEIKVPRNPEVFIKSSPVCGKNNKTTRFLCTAHWLPSPANLVWFENTTLISNTTTNTSVDDGSYMSQSLVELHHLSPRVGLIQCRANYLSRDSAHKQTIHTQLLIDTFVPSVYFTYNGILLGKHLVLEEGKFLGKFACRVNGDRVVNAVLVVCQILNNVTNFSSLAGSVEFDIPQVTSKDTGTCYCSASSCFNPTVNFTFSSGYPAHSQPTVQRRWSESYISNIYYVIAGCFALVFLVFFLATIIFLARRWNKLYTYVYEKFYSQSQTQAKDVLNGSHHYYSVANGVANNVLTFVPVEPLESESFVGNDRTSISSSNSYYSHVYNNVDVDNEELYSQCIELLPTLNPSPAETNTYYNLTNNGIPKLATTQTIIVSKVVQAKPIKSSGTSQLSDLVVDSLPTYAKTRMPPKPCRKHRCPDLLLHRPALSPQISSSDDEQQSQIFHELPQQTA